MKQFRWENSLKSGGGFHQLSVLFVHRENPAESELLREIVHRQHTLVTWERDLHRARFALASNKFDLVVADECLPDGAGESLIADRRSDSLQRWTTILLTDGADAHKTASAIKRGAAGVVDRMGGARRLISLIERVWASAHDPQRTGATGDAPRPCISTSDVIIGSSPPIQLLRKNIQRLAPIPVDVMLFGETGTGKDLAVQQLHALSKRSGPLVALNCGAIPDALFESELFGHEVGAFTGASRSRMGTFEQANKGTLFLDEIDSMPMNQQVKLLRVLETRRVDRVGGGGARPILDLRVFAASQGPLDEACRQGRFRLDLWHRLNVVTLELPPLRARRSDVPELWQHYVDEACAQYHIDGDSLPEAGLARLCAHDWPGNVRELKHAAQRFVLGLEALPLSHETAEPSPRLVTQMASLERELIVATLRRNGRRISAAASELGISAKTLSRRVAAYGLNAEPPFAV